MRSTEPRPRNALADGSRRSGKIIKLKVLTKQHPPHQQQAPATPAASASRPDEISSSSCSQQPTSLLYNPQLWHASGHMFQHHTCARELYFAGVAVPAPVWKQLPDDSSQDAGQHKRVKLGNGHYRARTAAAAGLTAADALLPHSLLHKPMHRQAPSPAGSHVPAGSHPAALAAAASAATGSHVPAGSHAAAVAAAASAAVTASFVDERVHSSMGASSSSSSHQEPAAVNRRRESASSTEVAAAVPWPLVVAVKGRRSQRQRRTCWLRWQAILAGNVDAADAAAGSTAVAVAAAAANAAVAVGDAELAVQASQQCPMLCEGGPQQQQAQSLLLHPAQKRHQQHQAKQQQQKQAAALLHQLAPTTPGAGRQSHSAFAGYSSSECVTVVLAKPDKQCGPGSAAAATGDASPQETSTSSDQTHDGMQDSPRAQVPLSSWPSSSTDSVCQLQQQLMLMQHQQQQHHQQQQRLEGSVQLKKSDAACWASPGSPLPAAAL